MSLYSKFIVTGLPKCTCRSSDVDRLFSTVAQVKKVKLNSEKGCATVTLWDRSSVDFILSQRWKLNGSVLMLKAFRNFHHNTHKRHTVYTDNTVHDTAISHSHCMGQDKTNQPLTGFTYSQYKGTASSFWKEVSYSCCKRVTSSQGKRRKTPILLSNHTQLTVQTCENRKKKKKKKLKRKNKNSTLKVNATVVPVNENRTAISKVIDCKSVSGAIKSNAISTKSNYEQVSSAICSKVINTKSNDKPVSSAIYSNVINTKSGDQPVSSAIFSNVMNTKSDDQPFSRAICSNMINNNSEEKPSSSTETPTIEIFSLSQQRSPIFNATIQESTLLSDQAKPSVQSQKLNWLCQDIETFDCIKRNVLLNMSVDVKTPLYVHSFTSKYLVYVNPHSLEDIQKCIMDKSRIPMNLQMITYQGKLLTKDRDITVQPYDFVQVLVRARGGMEKGDSKQNINIENDQSDEKHCDGVHTAIRSKQSDIKKSKDCKPIAKSEEEMADQEGATGGEEITADDKIMSETDDDPASFVSCITKKSSNHDVQKWLSYIGITDEIVKQYESLQYLDGDTIIDNYHLKDSNQFATDLGVPIGLARKILILKDSNINPFTSEMANWNSQQLKQKIVEKFPNKEMIERLTNSMEDKMIDGFVFMSYANPDDMASDFKDLTSVTKIVFLSVLKERDKLLGKTTEKEQSKIITKEKQQINPPSPERVKGDKLQHFYEFINKKMHLQLHQNTNDKTLCSCKIKLIDIPWKSCNEFQKKFQFVVLCQESEYTNQNQERGLWKHIRKNTALWIDTCSKTDKDLTLYQQSKKKNTTEYSLVEKTSTWKNLMEKEINDIERFKHYIVLVSKHILKEDAVYKAVLNENKKNPGFFYFSFDRHHSHILFDPEDFSYGFKIHSEVNEKTPEIAENTVVRNLQYQDPRPFKVDSDYFNYFQGHILPKPESSGTMLNRCTEYKLFVTSVKTKTFLEKFLKETLRFVAGCLNTRRNGTIYFGVGDSIGSQYNHGEIVGYSDEDNEVKVECTDNLRSAIKSCFSSECNGTADKCISDPYFLRVKPNSTACNEHLYVMEIDVEPKSSICGNLHFDINMAKCKIKLKGVKDKYILYARESSSSCEVDEKEKKGFINKDLVDYIKSRNSEEAERSTPMSPIEKPSQKLCRILCKGKDKLDKSSYPIFVLGKPTEQQKQMDNWMNMMSFIKRFPFIQAVFDFDDRSNINGFSKHIRNKDYSTVTSCQTFNLTYVDNPQDLINKFHRNKTIWIFANGQEDVSPPQPHLRNGEWQQRYVGVGDAVTFFSKHSVIPRARALNLIMLFSNDFDGIIDTFIEIHKRFKKEQILILAEEISIFKMFEDQVYRKVGSGISDLGEMCVVGITWNDVRAIIHDLVGYEGDGDFWLPSTGMAGYLSPVNERFRERMSDLELLNSKQCETKKSKDANTRLCVKKEKEMEFYKGNKVSWWNFYYESHVLKRHCFENIRSKIEKILKSPERLKYNVDTFNLEHEPGAGGSTLARHILWSLRKDFKCAVVTNLTENTSHQILELWKFVCEEQGQELFQEEKAYPLLLLLDDISQLEVTNDEFIRNVKQVFRKETKCQKLKCLVIICSRVDESQSVVLAQTLTEEEKIWMEDKHAELEEEGSLDLKPESLLAFMALRSGFNKTKIASIVNGLMEKLEISSFEFELMLFIALITEKTPNFRRSTKIAVPLECCDDFHYFTDDAIARTSWERVLPRPLNILLLFEDKENAGGKQIRMAHPMLAEAVLKYVLKVENKRLSELAIRMLRSYFMKCTSRGRDDLLETVHHLLNRRRVIDDEKQTPFSPLIESIINEESNGKEKGYEYASCVLKEGYKLYINDKKLDKFAGTISQTLARLHSKWKHFDDAVTWAKQSLELASKENRCYFLHTYGNVLKEQFQYCRDKKLKKQLGQDKTLPGQDKKLLPKDATQLLRIIIDALKTFIKAQNENTESSSNAVLYSYKDAVVSINLVCSFLKYSVLFSPDVDFKRFLIDKEYIPDDLLEHWGNDIISTLKNLKVHGEKAFLIFERQVCFYTSFQEGRLLGQSNSDRIHRTHKDIKQDYEGLVAEFSAMFGENDDEPPDILCTPEMVSTRDEWHRRRILHLQGNTYMNIFALYGKCKKSRPGFTTPETITRFGCIKNNYSLIKCKAPGDLAISVCINIALGLIGGKRDSLNAIIDMCTDLKSQTKGRHDVKKELYDLACYFIVVLMWPIKGNKANYDGELFDESLRHLKSISKRKPAKVIKGRDMTFHREENVRSKPTTQFFIANENQSKFPLLCHRFDIFFNEHSQDDDSIWEKGLTKSILHRIHGQVVTRGETSYQCISIKNEKAPDKVIEINQLRGKSRELLSEEAVTFYLGFSMSGPIAYNIKPVRDEEVST